MQHLIRKHQQKVWELISDPKCHTYICGDSSMGEQVKAEVSRGQTYRPRGRPNICRNSCCRGALEALLNQKPAGYHHLAKVQLVLEQRWLSRDSRSKHKLYACLLPTGLVFGAKCRFLCMPKNTKRKKNCVVYIFFPCVQNTVFGRPKLGFFAIKLAKQRRTLKEGSGKHVRVTTPKRFPNSC